MPTFQDIVSRIQGNLAVTDPDLDTGVGETTRKIIDAVAEPIAEAYIDQHVSTYTYDIDSKAGADLDAFVQNFGLQRIAARRASGTVVFTRATGDDAKKIIFIPTGIQVATNTSPQVVVQTLFGGTLDIGLTSVQVPVQAVQPGPAGDIPAGSASLLLNALGVNIGVTNIDALTGGQAQETDSALAARWKRTVFRNLAGTTQMFTGIALADPDCNAVNVIGSTKRWREQVQIGSDGTAMSSIPAKAVYVYPYDALLGPDVDNGFLLLKDFDWTFDNTYADAQGFIHPIVVMKNSTYAVAAPTASDPLANDEVPVVGAIFDLDFQYVPEASRNRPLNGITNRVDVWCGGQRPVTAVQSVIFAAGTRFTNIDGDAYQASVFVRPDGSQAVVNNTFVPLAYGPIISLPDEIKLADVFYKRARTAAQLGTTDTDGAVFAYTIVHEDDAFGYTPKSRFGIEWDQNHLPPDGTPFVVGGNGDYVYNQVPQSVQKAIDAWRLASIDVQAHAAKQVPLRVNLVLMYDRTADRNSTNEAINVALAQFLSTQGFDSTVQISDLLQVVHNVAGVDNVRMATSQDSSVAFAVQWMIDGVVNQTYQDSQGRATDVEFGDDTVPVFDSITVQVRAQNTFGRGA